MVRIRGGAYRPPLYFALKRIENGIILDEINFRKWLFSKVEVLWSKKKVEGILYLEYILEFFVHSTIIEMTGAFQADLARVTDPRSPNN